MRPRLRHNPQPLIRRWSAHGAPSNSSICSGSCELRSPLGRRPAAVMNNLIATCKRLRIDPFAYLRDIFERIAAHPKNQLEQLLPDKWKAARTAGAS